MKSRHLKIKPLLPVVGVVFGVLIAFVLIFLINMITGKHMRNVRKW